MTDTRTTWPTPRDHLCWGTSELRTAAEYIDLDEDAVARLAQANGRRYLTVRGRLMRLRQERDWRAASHTRREER